MSRTTDDRRLGYLDTQDFTKLFIEELGWERPKAKPKAITVDDVTCNVNPVAEYRGIRIWECGQIPDSRAQRAIDVELKKDAAERLLIFHDPAHQQWRWPLSSDSQGRGTSRIVTHEHYTGKKTEALLQRLAMIRIGLDEEPSVVEVVGRLRKAFDAEAVTRSFYTRFADEAESLSSLIKGIKSEADRDWYAALLLNRLMFIYFMQRKGFMDSDPDYLRNRLAQVRQVAGPNKFYLFYSDFLLPLFHEGLGSPDRPVTHTELAPLIGDIPYVNGGIFSTHPLEAAHNIKVPDKAFETIFDLFDQYQWHLDDRPSGRPNEINPDVLGYIFEQFINNKEQGAYYTKEDVTYFMTSSTLLPAFLDRLIEVTGVNPWAYLEADPARYIWQSLGYAVEEPLPESVAAEQTGFPRPAWNAWAPESHALPGETWWEVVDRRDRHGALLQQLRTGEVASVDAAQQANLDLETLTIDVIDRLDSPADVAAAWKTLSGLRVIDPTCGSGAFLFAALKILEVLYEAILEAADRHGKTTRDPDLLRLLEEADRHPSRHYFCLKHAAINNLYGVDLMNEAVEIARLRLFLKLVAAVNDRASLEPLPDLDFNIKSGNVLVGAQSIEEIASHTTNLFAVDGLDDVVAAAQETAKAYADFQEATENNDYERASKLKRTLVEVLDTTRDIVDRQYYANEGRKQPSFDEWRHSYQPFHWFVEFPEVFADGGFDVVIGNPPYVAKRKVKGYTYQGFKTDALPDIYAPCVERATNITSDRGRFAMILPISCQFSNDFAVLRTLLEDRYPALWVSTFSRNPSALFSAGLGVRSTIVIGSRKSDSVTRSFTKAHRWVEEFRPALFETLAYFDLEGTKSGPMWLRPTSQEFVELVEKSMRGGGTFASAVRSRTPHSLGFKQTSLYYLSVFNEDPPAFELDCRPTAQTKIGRVSLGSSQDRAIGLAVLLSKFAFVWWYATGDDFDVTQDGLKSTPVDIASMSTESRKALEVLGVEIDQRLPEHPIFTKYAGKWMGNYVISEMRDLTDQVDLILAREKGYEELLPALEHAYYCVFKPTGDRPGTLRESPCK